MCVPVPVPFCACTFMRIACFQTYLLICTLKRTDLSLYILADSRALQFCGFYIQSCICIIFICNSTIIWHSVISLIPLQYFAFCSFVVSLKDCFFQPTSNHRHSIKPSNIQIQSSAFSLFFLILSTVMVGRQFDGYCLHLFAYFVNVSLIFIQTKTCRLILKITYFE